VKYPPHEEGSAILQETRGFNIIFIHSSLDDAGLTPQEFRLFAHLSRRAGEGVAFAAAASMAKACRMHPDTVWAALSELERRNMVVRETRPGKTTQIRLTKPSDWNLQPTGLEGHPLKPGDGNGGVTPTPPNRVAPTGLEGHEGNPIRVSKESNPSSAPSVAADCATCSSVFGDVEQIQLGPQQEKKAPSFHTQFIAAWSEAYLTVRGEKYLVSGGKDASAVKRIASMGMSVADLIALARRAWASSGPKFWHCEKAITISYFVSSFNEIRAELSAKPTPSNATHSKNPAEHPRNRHIAGAGTGPTTTEILRRRAEREAAERAAAEAAERLPSPVGPVAGEVAPVEQYPSESFGSV